MNLATRIHLVASLGTSGATYPLLLNAFVTCTGTTLLVTDIKRIIFFNDAFSI